MLREDVRRKALRMAAKVALGAFVAGCSGRVEIGASGASGASGGTGGNGGSAAIEDAGPMGDSSAVCSLPEMGLPSDAEEHCCEALVAATFPDDAGAVITDADAATPELAACCKAVIAQHDALVVSGMPPGSGLTWSQIYDCCGVLNYPAGPTCTPWGPPVPPELPAHIDVDAWLAEIA